MASVTLTEVGKVFPGGVHAVRDVSLSIADGEFVVLVGPSGCGKSTTLRVIAGLEDATTGQVRIGPRVVNHLPPGDRDIAMVFQDFALYPHKTVRQNMAFGLRMRRTPKAEITRRVADAARMLAIEPLLDRRPKALSGGQQQRAALGRAIVRQPAAFLFDEPLSNLDAKLRSEMRTEIAGLHRRLDATMVYVTHDQVEAMTLGDRLVLMDRGVIQQQGRPLEVYNRPANRFVATFIGSPPMNVFDGEVRGGVFQADGLRCPVRTGHEGPAALGVRPEDLTLDPPGDGGVVTIRVTAVERLGHETLLHGHAAGQACAARLPPGALGDGAREARLAVRAGAPHLFSAGADGPRIA